ncbi:GHMP kinase [Methanocella sp. CWC-04]|uniref:Pantoate kinase n=1 Tax=Methanooceanicella nereidis TaxID=2052831 RepID=A0AAP2RC20_9EURY|nr:pantoate kinase [Methanocella sp. CWC-04]MCD1294796.1 GHMP kinase [Methanocella sp. CWC-04]
MMGKAFAPAHITGFFIVHEEDDPLRMGSCGCGLALDDGAYTEVSPSDRTEIFLNGKETDAVTTRTLIELLTDKPVTVKSRLSIPVGGGFGASGAGALSTALALNKALKLEKTFNDLSYAAHVAEVRNSTGLGDVAGMTCGGVTVRLKPGTPFIIDRIPVPAMDIYYISFGPLSTKTILSDSKERELINKAGKKCLDGLLRRPTFENFMKLSRDFSVDTGLISSRAMDAVEAVESHGGMASMAMLGDTVFSTMPEGLYEFGEVRKTKINLSGAHLI